MIIVIKPQMNGKYIATVGEYVVGDNYTTAEQAMKKAYRYVKSQNK